MYGAYLLLALAAAGDTSVIIPADKQTPLDRPTGEVILLWNETALHAIRTAKTPPPLAARNLAILHVAVYDAVNALYRTHDDYRFLTTMPPGTSPTAAAAVAAHRVLVALYPRQIDSFDAALDTSLAEVPDGEDKRGGMLLGQAIAERVLDWRRRDGSARQVTYTPGTAAGFWQPTPPEFRAPLLPQWSAVTCFCMKGGSQFRPAAPPSLTSPEYAANFREVKLLGGVASPARTHEQTVIARFWADGEGTVTPPGHWNRIAQGVARERGTTLAEKARLFALLNLALADAGVASWDCKYHFHVWRPVQAIRQADPGVNPETTPDPSWTPLLPTPPFPSYTSGHSTFSAAAAIVLATFFGTDDVRFTSTSESLPGVARTFTSFWAAAEEAGKSRIYGGIHWEFDNREGLASGRALGEYVSRHFLLPRAVTGTATTSVRGFSASRVR